MSPKDRDRLSEIKRRSKLGGGISEDDRLFVKRTWLRHRDEFREVENEVRQWAMQAMNPLASRE